jgi:drug/metabolite transporter (DMT)-like permease
MSERAAGWSGMVALTVAAAAFAGVQNGLATVAARYAVTEVPPAALAMVRYAIAAACLIWPAMAVGWPRLGRQLVPVALLGMAQFGGLMVLFHTALQYIPAGRVALLFTTFPFMTMAIAWLLGRERPGWAKGFGVALTVAGVALALGDRASLGAAAAEAWKGDVAVLASAFIGSVCTVLFRPYLERHGALPVGLVSMLAAVCLLALLAATEGFHVGWRQVSGTVWLVVAFIGASSAAGYLAWLWALRHAPPTRVSVFLALSPVTATGFGAAVLGETVSAAFLTGLGLVAAGLWLAHRPAPDER